MSPCKTNISNKSGPGTIGKLYLVAYNSSQVIGWFYLLYQVVAHYLNGGSNDNVWETVKITVIVFQNAALLEILNIAIGLVKSNLFLTTFQVFSRVFAVCGVLVACPYSQQSVGLLLLLFAWSVTEVIRYGYYALNLIDSVPYPLIWCRYTFFYVLYPIGVTGELLSIYHAVLYAGKTKLWTIELPNIWNFTFNYQYFLIVVMLTYIPVFPMLYLHMIGHRKKIIGDGSTETKSTQKKSKNS